jgi:cytochrome c553
MKALDRLAGHRATTLAGLLATLLASTSPAAAADIEAGKAKAAMVCAACHGANGLSIADTIPNLAGQRVPYLESQLRALKAGTRKAASMNAIASQLSPADIANVAAYFGSLVPANTAVRSDQLPTLARTQVTFPEGYKAGYRLYQTVNRPDINQVRYLYANPLAWQAAREGRPLPDGSVLLLEQHAAKLDADKKPVMGADGYFVSDKLLAYSLMASGADWGKDFPDMLRNGNWNYAVYNPDMKPRAINQADCLACHKPLDKQSYAFSIEPLTVAARR